MEKNHALHLYMHRTSGYWHAILIRRRGAYEPISLGM
jgi:hypothetical protein